MTEIERGDTSASTTPENENILKELLELKEFKKEILEQMAALNKGNQPLSFNPIPVASSQDDTILKVVQAVQGTMTENKGYVSMDKIDPADILEKPVQFTAHGLFHLVLDDKRNGMPVLPPSKRKFLFKPNGRTRSQRIVGDKVEIVFNNFCSILVDSKKDVEWLRNHTMYGINFYENTNEAVSMDVYIAQVALNILKNLDVLSDTEIIGRAKAAQIAIGDDIRLLKNKIAVTEAKNIMAEHDTVEATKYKEKEEKRLMEENHK